MARNIFNQPENAKTQPAPSKATKPSSSVSGLRESLLEITANSIRDIDPKDIVSDGLQDRLLLEDDSIEALAERIRKNGQHVPIMVRPAKRPDQYRIVYGRRRLAAVRKIGGTIKAIVRTLDDDASLIAQGQENSLRLDPSFIEMALFIREMQAARYKPGIIQEALGLTRQGVSNHRVVLERLPDELVRLIGPAHGIGRRQWGDLADLVAAHPMKDRAKKAVDALAEGASSTDRFHAVFTAAQKADRARAKPGQGALALTTQSGDLLGTLASSSRAVIVKIARKDNPEFCQWVEQNAEDTLRRLFDQWRTESDQDTPGR